MIMFNISLTGDQSSVSVISPEVLCKSSSPGAQDHRGSSLPQPITGPWCDSPEKLGSPSIEVRISSIGGLIVICTILGVPY